MCHFPVDSNEQMKPGDENLAEANNSPSQSHCVDPEPGTAGKNGSNSYEAPLISPHSSLTNSDSFASSCSDSSVDINPNDRDYVEEDQEDQKFKPNGHVRKSSSVSLVNGLDQSDVAAYHSIKEDEDGRILKDVEITGTTDGHDIKADHGVGAGGSLDDENETSHSFDDEMDSQIWMPPEAENEEDEREDSIATLDDDDEEYGDGMKWSKPSSLNGFEEGINRSVQFKEAKQKAMEEVMSGKFKNLVSQILKSVGVDNSERDGESWVDIVTSLAWQAASFLKPGAIEGKAVDPAGHVKVKCIATGSRSESLLIKGLVFKKHAAHKHMPTKYNNPKLLLIRGMLGQSSGLSSFNSMISQEKDNQKKDSLADDLKPLIDNLEACQPNVVLVEKSVSRDVLEAIHKMGMTLVIDMKLHRLERVARCTGSPILSSDIMLSQKLKQCDSLYFEKFVEEHVHVGEGEKKPRKTLMFVEGCPTRLDCTILLKGSHSDELKRIKCVVQCAVVMAYHFILETSFLLDQKAMFSTIALGRIVCTLPSNQQYSRAGSFTSSVCHEESAAIAASANREGSHHLEETTVLLEPNCLGNDANSSVPPDKDTTADTASANASDVPIVNGFHEDQSLHAEESTSTTAPSCELDIPISNGFHQGRPYKSNLVLEGKSIVHDEPCVLDISSEMSSISASLRKVIGENLSHVSPTAYQSMCTYLGLNERETDAQASLADRVLPVGVPAQGELEAKDCSNEEKVLNSDSQPSDANPEATEDTRKAVGDNEDSMRGKDDINSVLDSESILVLMSSRNASRGTVCEQSHFSHIKFYRNFDVPLGKFLRDNLLNQSLQCKTCGELPEAHFYYYAHHNKQLTIRVKHIPNTIRLSGESEGKLWMWSRCGKCKPNNGSLKSTKRVVISGAARRLSFGKFLELSFSSDSSFNGLSSCGHSLHRDFLYFFGLGPMVAMFKFSRVSTYTVSVPPQKLEFNNSIKGDWLEKETENVYTKGVLVFSEVADYLKKIKSRFSGIILNLGGSLKEISDIEEMLNAERAEFEDDIKSSCIDSGQSVRNLLCLNRLRSELLLVACIWDQRLQVLLSDSATCGATAPDNMTQRTDPDHSAEGEIEPTPANAAGDEMTQAAEIVGAMQCITDNGHTSVRIEGAVPVLSDGHKAFENCSNVEVPIERTAGQDDSMIKEIPHEEGMVQESREQKDLLTLSSTIAQIIQGPSSGTALPSISSAQDFPKPMITDHQTSDENGQTASTPMSDHLLADRTIPILADQDDSSVVNGNTSERVSSPPISYLENSKGWLWNPFSVIWQDCMKDLDKGRLPIFEFLTKFKLPHPPDCLPAVSQVIIEEGARLHIPLSNYHYIVSDYEGEISSIIACAVALMEDLPPSEQDLNEDGQKEKVTANSTNEVSVVLPRAFSAPSPHYSLTVSSDSDVLRPTPNMTLQSRLSSFDGLNLLDSLVSFGALHPEIPLGVEKYLGKGKYSVVCLYAHEFRALRNRCCPSELDYISALSRCKNWDAKGGKSKSFFAKTLDDRLIIKEIKKTEFESFMKFAPDYFRHMNQSFASGNQTCLAKILGIYQVTIRQTKSGKELKHDLMVMENLSFGRNITRQYDLKGALHARFTAGDGSGDVLLDQNFVNDMNVSPIYVGQKAKRLLQRAVWNDTTFLNSVNVMDYSLLVGVDRQRQELVCGIIDYLRQYTWDKQLETWVKSSLVVPKNVLPTIISPKEYKKRFRKFMDTHFLTVPDHWCSQRSSNPCKLCGIRGDETPQVKPAKPEELNGF